MDETTEGIPVVLSGNVSNDAGERTVALFPEATKQPQRPRARKPVAPPVAVEVPHLSPFGAVPPLAHHWGIRKRTLAGGWETLGWAEPGAMAKAKEWPLSELSVDTIQDRWGAGTYEVQWVVAYGDRGGRRVQRGGREVEILPRVAPAPPVAEPSTVATNAFLAGPMGDALQMMQLLDGMADKKIAGLAQLAQLMGGGGARSEGGITRDGLELILRNQREASEVSMRAIVQPLQTELAAVRRDLDAEEDDTGGGGIAGAAVAGAAQFVKGKGFGAQALNFLAANPAMAQTVVVGVTDLLGKVVAAVQAAAKPPVAVAAPAPVFAPGPYVGPVAVSRPVPAPVTNGWQSHDPPVAPSSPPPATSPAGPDAS